MNGAVIIIVLTTLLIHCSHCQQRVTFSALQDTPKTLHSLNMRSISNRLQNCTRSNFANFVRQKCGYEITWDQEVPNKVSCQQPCRDALVGYLTQCNSQAAADNLVELCSRNNAGTHNATSFKALFLMTSIVMAMLLL